MKNTRFSLLASASMALFVLVAPIRVIGVQTDPYSAYVNRVLDGEVSESGVPEKSGSTGWWATGWSKEDGDGFHGKPVSMVYPQVVPETQIVVRYTRYTTDYDVALHSPIWGAYTLTAAAVDVELAGERTSSNKDFARPSQFFQEPLVVLLSGRLGFIPAKHQNFSDAMDPRYPVDKLLTVKKASHDAAIIQRGHMVPNNAMKCLGTYEEGQVAQLESFSVANIVPQMAKSNSPSWSGLESAVFDWAKELTHVWVIVGPIYHDKTKLHFAEKRTTGAPQVVPCPDELYYVVIGNRDGKTSAIAFLMPHIPESVNYKTRAVPVDKIEELTGLNFMPELGEPNPIETMYDNEWIMTPKRKLVEDDEN